MALFFPVMINDTQIGYFYAVRTSGDMTPDSVGTYNIDIYANGEVYHVDGLEHRYGDGAWTLIATTLMRSELTALTHGLDTPNTE